MQSLPLLLPKTLVIGSKSHLGKVLFQKYQEHYPDTIGTHYLSTNPKLQLDLNHPKLPLLNIEKGNYSWALITAAQTNLAACELEKNAPFRKNVEGLKMLLRDLHALGIKPILFSSDYVFDGKLGGYDESSKTHPINEYGKQKEDLEKTISSICGDHYLIIRCSKIYGLNPGDGSLIDQIASPLLEKTSIRAAHDQIFAPIYMDDVVKVVLALQAKDATGLFNLCGNEIWSRFSLAQEISKILNVPNSLIKKISLDDLKTPYLLPKRTNLICNKIQEVINPHLTPLSQAIQKIPEKYIENRYTAHLS